MTTEATLTVKEILDRLDTTESICYGEEHLLRECNIEENWVNVPENTLTQKPINTWICTDSEVGLFAIYLKGEFVCLSYQATRRSSPTFQWASKEAYEKTRQFLVSLVDEQRGKEDIKLVNMDQKVPLYRTRDYLSELIHESDSEALYEGKTVKVLISETYKSLREQENNDNTLYGKVQVLIELDGDRKEVKISNLKFPVKLRG